ncbi:hypothetical protein CURTO8I2_220309 [Curtobacterium sp. 8I-2]|nr:hypothetical protein CURTO8I2_220309 [Curtobacterium sp. 8I-2]
MRGRVRDARRSGARGRGRLERRGPDRTRRRRRPRLRPGVPAGRRGSFVGGAHPRREERAVAPQQGVPRDRAGRPGALRRLSAGARSDPNDRSRPGPRDHVVRGDFVVRRRADAPDSRCCD